MKRSANAEEFIANHSQWNDILVPLRKLLAESELEETIKWGVPVYTLDGKNVVGLTAFKNFAALWFFQGALLDDPEGVLVNAQEGRTQAQRQWRFEKIEDLNIESVSAYVAAATENQRQGKSVKPQPKKAVAVPEELAQALAGDAVLIAAFETLAPYKQREYCEFIATAKRADTRARRLEKSLPMIRDGLGLNDRYRC